jgi:acyl-CoA synthetase (AMP-forming)/AMP-acid ligase II
MDAGRMELLHSLCLLRERNERPALTVPALGFSADYGGLAHGAAALARALEDAGIARGARIALMMPPSPAFVTVLFAALARGAAVAPVDTSLRGLSLASALDRLDPDLLAAPAAALKRLPEGTAAPRRVLAIEETVVSPAPALVATLIADGRAERLHIPLAGPLTGPLAAMLHGPDGMEDTDDALLVSTSGSTGHPKYVRLGHAGTVFNARGHLAALDLHSPFTALQALDVGYSYGLIASLLATFVAGGTLVLPNGTDAKAIREATAGGSPSVCLASPALLDYLVDTCPPGEEDVLRRLEKIGIGGDHCRESLRAKLAGFFPASGFYVTYGITEAGPRVATLPPDDFLRRPRSVGLPLDGVRLEVLDADGRSCQAGMVGTLRVLTPSRMNGYLGDASGPVAAGTAAGTADDWLTTGDLANLDEAGFLTIHGRADRQFKHRGRRVNPAQIEMVLECFPGIVSARAEPAEEDGDLLRAVVFLRAGEDAEDLPRRLREHCRRNLPGRLVPGEIVTVVEDSGYFFKGRPLKARESIA